jgi:hypothetical protein
MKKLLIVILIILFLNSFALAEKEVTQPLPEQVILRYVQQEELRTRSEIKGYITEQMKTNLDDTQKLIDTNKQIIYRDLKSMSRDAIVKLGIVWFVATLCAMLVYRFIVMAIRQKFVKRGFRDEYYG